MEFKKEKFKRLRKELRWSYTALAEKIGITNRTVSNWEKGITIPSEENIFKIADILGVSVSTISDKKTTHKSSIDLTNATVSWISLFEEKAKTQKEIHYISHTLNQLSDKLNNASIIIFGILNSLHFPVYIKNSHNKIIMVNKSFLSNISFINENEFSFFNTPKTDYDFFSKAEARLNLLEDMEVMMNNKSIIDKEGYIPGSRKKKWGLITKIPITDDENSLSGVIGVFVDITDRKQEEKKRMLLERILNNIPILIYLKDIEKGKIVYANDYFADFFKINKSEIYSNSVQWQKIRNSDFMKERDEKLERSKKSPIQIILTANKSEECERVFRETVFKIDNKYLIGTCLEITETQKTEKLKNDFIKLNDISEEMTVLIRHNEKEGTWDVEYVNNVTLDLCGIETEKILKDHTIWRNIIYPDDREKFQNWCNNQKYPKELEYRIIHGKTAKVVWIHDKQYRIGNKQYSIIKDITSRKNMEQKNMELIDYNEIFIKYLDSSIEAYFIQAIKPREQLLYISDGYAELYGCPKEEFYEDFYLWRKFVHPKDRARINKEFEFFVKHFNKKMLEDKKISYSIINNFGVEMNHECTLTTIVKDTGKVVILGCIRVLE